MKISLKVDISFLRIFEFIFQMEKAVYKGLLVVWLVKKDEKGDVNIVSWLHGMLY